MNNWSKVIHWAKSTPARSRSMAPVSGRSAVLATAVALFGVIGTANADYVLNTGTPSGSSQLVLSTSQSFAAEFYIQAGQTVTNLSAYIEQVTGNNNAYEFEIFSNNPTFIGARPPSSLYSVNATASSTSEGWSSTVANWTPTTSGDYWVAVLAPNVGSTFDLQTLTSTSTGSPAALAFASTNTPGTRYATLNTGIGLQVSTVPLPAAVWLLLSGLGGLGLARKRKTA